MLADRGDGGAGAGGSFRGADSPRCISIWPGGSISADPAVRKELARALPELRSIDAAPWLMQLGKDADAEVRLTAITLMATSGDPLLLEEVERVAGNDSDPRIREQVDRIAEQRNNASQRGAATVPRSQLR